MAAAITTVSSSIEAQAFQIALAMQALELAIPEDTRPDRIQVVYDTEGRTVSLTFNLDTSTALVGGKAEISVVPYLS